MQGHTWADTYPRPQLRRASFLPLLAGWTLNGSTITLPYPPQASLSGFGGEIGAELHYQTTFTLPEAFSRPLDRIWLHFGAVDAVATVRVNGRQVAVNYGGYLPFGADITAALRPGENVLELDATDTLDKTYPYGKQSRVSAGMWYTQVSGIWQTVWLEAVPPHAVTALRITPDLNGVALEITTDAPQCTVTVALPGGGTLCQTLAAGQSSTYLDIAAAEPPRRWSPQHPYLYTMTLQTETDCVQSYFALRTVSIEPAADGLPRLCLNGEPLFLHGLLDQGYFADGLYLPKSPDGYAEDVDRCKALGFNLLRKHIKIEPEAFYHACDAAGVLVLQDFVNNGSYSWFWDTALPNLGLQRRLDKFPGGAARKAVFRAHSAATQRHLYNHPCIIGYTIFNEGWGQFDADARYDQCRAADPTRFYDATSGWFAQKRSDVDSRHLYFRNRVLKARGARPLLLSECGGYARPIQGHQHHPGDAYGYGDTDSEAALTAKLLALYNQTVLPSIPHGLCGCVYTQLSDVEAEINGLYTYDRTVCKVDAAALRTLAETLHAAYRRLALGKEETNGTRKNPTL